MRPERLLRWYPPAWRERYGDEFVACVADAVGDDSSVPVRMAVRIAGAGLRERAHDCGLVGLADGKDRVRAGSLAVLTGWALFVVGGAAFAKRTERLPGSFDRGAVAVLALVGGVAILTGSAVVVPATISYLRSGGRRTHRRLLVVMAATAATTVASTVGLVVLAHGASATVRRDGTGWYGAAFGLWCLLVVATIACWTVGAWVLGRRIELGRAIVEVERVCSAVATVAMVAMSVVIAVVLLRGGPSGAVADGGAILLSLVAADVVASYGLTRTLVRA